MSEIGRHRGPRLLTGGAAGPIARMSPPEASANTRPSDPTLSRLLLQLGTKSWLVGDAFQGVQIFGGTGSGKTTGSGAAIALALLRAGFGGLVLTAKADEIDLWRKYARLAGRSDDLIELTTHPDCAFNILEYEFRKGGGITHNLVTLLVGAMLTGDGKVSNSEPYWTEALRELLTHTIDLAVMGTAALEWREGPPPGASADWQPSPRLSLSDLVRIVRTAPQSVAEVGTGVWRQHSRCWELLSAADAFAASDELTDARYRDLDQTVAFWVNDFPSLSDRTRSIIVSTFTAKVAGLLRSPLRDLFCEGTNDRFSPEACFDANPARGGKGKIIVVNVPVKTFGEIGRLTQVLYKTIWERAADRRARLFSLPSSEIERMVAQHELTPADTQLTCPAFLWADESQYFVTQEDLLFQQTARGSRVATVYLTQNIGNYASALGDRGDEGKVASLLGNLQTKIFHANGDPKTNQYAETIFGKLWATKVSKSESQSDSIQQSGATTNRGASTSSSFQQVNALDARLFTMLSTGGRRFDWKVEGVVFQSGRKWDAPGRPPGEYTNFVVQEFDQVT